MSVVIRDLKFQLSDFSFGPQSFEFGDHGLFLIRGKNGSGKTSFLRCLLGRIRSSSGEVQGLRFPIATCGLEPLFVGSWTVKENIDWLLKLGNLAYEDKADLHSKQNLRKRFDRLSLGQRRQAELNFALHISTPVVFLDEPFTHLDQEHLALAAEEIQRASRTRLILMTSHQEVSSLQYEKVFHL